MNGGFNPFGAPARPRDVAADGGGRQPNTVPLGTYTGVPTPTRMFTILVTPETNGAGIAQNPTQVVPATRENRFVTLTAPAVGFAVYVGDSGVNSRMGLSLPPGLPYEVTLPGNQALWAVTDAPTWASLRVQIAPAITGDQERRM